MKLLQDVRVENQCQALVSKKAFQKKKKGNESQRRCYRCNGLGHFKADCPIIKKKKNFKENTSFYALSGRYITNIKSKWYLYAEAQMTKYKKIFINFNHIKTK